MSDLFYDIHKQGWVVPKEEKDSDGIFIRLKAEKHIQERHSDDPDGYAVYIRTLKSLDEYNKQKHKFKIPFTYKTLRSITTGRAKAPHTVYVLLYYCQFTRRVIKEWGYIPLQRLHTLLPPSLHEIHTLLPPFGKRKPSSSEPLYGYISQSDCAIELPSMPIPPPFYQLNYSGLYRHPEKEYTLVYPSPFRHFTKDAIRSACVIRQQSYELTRYGYNNEDRMPTHLHEFIHLQYDRSALMDIASFHAALWILTQPYIPGLGPNRNKWGRYDKDSSTQRYLLINKWINDEVSLFSYRIDRTCMYDEELLPSGCKKVTRKQVVDLMADYTEQEMADQPGINHQSSIDMAEYFRKWEPASRHFIISDFEHAIEGMKQRRVLMFQGAAIFPIELIKPTILNRFRRRLCEIASNKIKQNMEQRRQTRFPVIGELAGFVGVKNDPEALVEEFKIEPVEIAELKKNGPECLQYMVGMIGNGTESFHFNREQREQGYPTLLYNGAQPKDIEDLINRSAPRVYKGVAGKSQLRGIMNELKWSAKKSLTMPYEANCTRLAKAGLCPHANRNKNNNEITDPTSLCAQHLQRITNKTNVTFMSKPSYFIGLVRKHIILTSNENNNI